MVRHGSGGPKARRGMALASLVLACGLGSACVGDDPGQVPGTFLVEATPATSRAERRLFDGAPPTLPHGPLGADCSECHGQGGISVEGLGYSPPSPHPDPSRSGAMANCVQCHVPEAAEGVFVENSFAGLRQDLRRGRRLNEFAPPVMPHRTFLRENCQACHTGPAAREEIRTDHPERIHCLQCHVEAVVTTTFPPVYPSP